MGDGPFSAALELSCAYDQPRAGVAYAAIRQVQALSRLEGRPYLRLFATRAGNSATRVDEFAGVFSKECVLNRAGAIKRNLWTSLNAPPMEWFLGSCAVAHGFFHLLPAARKAARIVTVHDLSFLRHPEFHTAETVAMHTKMVSHAAKYADTVITVSESIRQEVLETYSQLDEDRVIAVPNGVEPEAIDEQAKETALKELGLARGGYAVYLGTLEPRKNVELLIDAFSRARAESGGDWKLLLIGKEGWKSEGLMGAVRDAAAEGHVVHAGHQPREVAVGLLSAARCSVYVSRYEGFGLPLLEAMAAGVPVVASDIPVFHEVAGDAAVFAPPEDAEAVAEKISALFRDDALCESLREKGRDRIGLFSWTASAEKLLGVYNRFRSD